MPRALLDRQAGVDPAHQPALDVQEVGNLVVDQGLLGLLGARARNAVEHDAFLPLQLRQVLTDVLDWQIDGAGKVADAILGGGAHVDYSHPICYQEAFPP
jgi:hypothetical protein